MRAPGCAPAWVQGGRLPCRMPVCTTVGVGQHDPECHPVQAGVMCPCANYICAFAIVHGRSACQCLSCFIPPGLPAALLGAQRMPAKHQLALWQRAALPGAALPPPPCLALSCQSRTVPKALSSPPQCAASPHPSGCVGGTHTGAPAHPFRMHRCMHSSNSTSAHPLASATATVAAWWVQT